jgi:hypothetical protein
VSRALAPVVVVRSLVSTDRRVRASTVGGNSTEVKRDGGCVALPNA